MGPRVCNLYDPMPRISATEDVTVLLGREGLRVERIVSHGHASPVDFWYQQQDDEWVCLLEGEAVLEFESGRLLPLVRGDSLLIPAGMRHRVASTGSPAVWLALFLPPDPRRRSDDG